MSRDPELRDKCVKLFEQTVNGYGMVFIGWREVPVNHYGCGPGARLSMPHIRQAFIGFDKDCQNIEKELYLLRRILEKSTARIHGDFYIASLSNKTICYKGMLHAHQMREFYPELGNPKMVSGFAIVHSRFSTNNAAFME